MLLFQICWGLALYYTMSNMEFVNRATDDFEITSAPGSGTTVVLRKWLR